MDAKVGNREPALENKHQDTDDITGQSRIAWNVFSSWTCYVVLVISGFLMPRLIDRHVGQHALGIWDFSWSIVNYFQLAGLGIGSSVNRYVAKYRAENDVVSLRIAVSSVCFMQLIIGIFITLATFLLVWVIPYFYQEKLGSELYDARWVIIFLGMTLAIQMAFDSYRGVMTGCHRWDLHNALNSASYFLIVCGMGAALELKGGLVSLSVIYFCGCLIAELVRRRCSRHVCPELQMGIRYVRYSEIRNLLVFGIKRIMIGIPEMLVVQGTSILIAWHLGPAALAVFSRPNALIRHAQTFVNKFALVLTPTAGSLQGSGRQKDLHELFLESTRVAAYLSLPMVCFLGILANPILRLWMGPNYEYGILLTILCIGYFLVLVQEPAASILIGMNSHGSIGMLSLATTLGMFGVGVIGFNAYGLTMEWAAAGIALFVGIGTGVVVLASGCRKLNVSPERFVKRVLLGPFVCNVPFAICLIAIRTLLTDRPLEALGVGCGATVLILGPLYWKIVIPASVRKKVVSATVGGERLIRAVNAITRRFTIRSV